MKRLTALFGLILGLASLVAAQGPVIAQGDQWTYAYEDLTDFLRRYPGMYPVDFGTLGAPVVFRPWHLEPWALQVSRDGIPQNRRYDGLFESNLQPAGELDSVRYDLLAGGGAGRFELTTRHLAADTPYTEFNIREGFYGYGTVDLAHGQRIYRSLTLEVTGRLAWYDGFRQRVITIPGETQFLFGKSRQYRLRGRVGYDLGPRWRAELTYGGVNNEPELNYARAFPSDPDVPFFSTLRTEREEGILSVGRSDSFRTSYSPRLRLFLRQDREEWSGPFKAREQVWGGVSEFHVALPRQKFSLRPMALLSEIDFAGMPEAHETAIELQASDSLDVGVGFLLAQGGFRHESLRLKGSVTEEYWLKNGGADFTSRTVRGFYVQGGAHYSEQTIPAAYRFGQYPVVQRPLPLAPDLANLESIFLGRDPQAAAEPERYLKTRGGLGWQRGDARVSANLLALSRPGTREYRFRNFAPETYLVHEPPVNEGARVGFYADGVIPLRWGLRLESSWFSQVWSGNLTELVDSRAYSRLYFEREFFSAPLIIRSHISHEYLGERTMFSDIGTWLLPAANVVGFRLSATVKGVTLVWGTENLLNQHYSLLPGYPMIGKEEYLQFIWRLWL